jgi:hypothetical protein
MEAAINAHDTDKKTGGRHHNESTSCESMREGILVYRVQMYNHRCMSIYGDINVET